MGQGGGGQCASQETGCLVRAGWGYAFNKYKHFRQMHDLFATRRDLDFAGRPKKKGNEMAAVIEKQAFQIEALKRLRKAK